jgi:precorrin-2 dehydrogenase/sirohydrochlorin ferrochelatase
MRSGDLQITVSTGGKSPALARRIRDDLACQFGPEFAEVVELLGKLREKLLTEKGNSRYNKKLFNDLVNHDLPEMIRNRSFSGLDHLLTTIFGPEYSLARLEMGKKDSE